MDIFWGRAKHVYDGTKYLMQKNSQRQHVILWFLNVGKIVWSGLFFNFLNSYFILEYSPWGHKELDMT